MKNREEYMASICAKRDARLAKRKRAVATAASALCLILCFCAAAAVMPKMMKKTSKEATTDITVAVNDAEGTVDSGNAQTMHYVEQFVTMVTHYERPAVERYEDSITHYQKNYAYSETDSTNQKVTAFEENEAGVEKQTEIALETEIAEEFADSETHKAPSVTKRPSAMGKYTNEEIIAAAFSNLSESEKEAVKGVEPFVTVTRTSGGEEYYDISYKTDNGKIKITLNAENLEFVKRSGGIDGTSGTTAAPPMVVTTPAYNPNS